MRNESGETASAFSFSPAHSAFGISVYNSLVNSPERTVRLSLSGHSYDIVVQPGLLASVGGRLRELSKSSKAIVVTDTNIPDATVSSLATSLLDAGCQAHVVIVP